LSVKQIPYCVASVNPSRFGTGIASDPISVREEAGKHYSY